MVAFHPTSHCEHTATAAPFLRLQRPQNGGHQVGREQHALDQLVRQRGGVGGHALLGGRLERRAVGAQPRGQVCEHVVRELAQPQAQPAGRHGSSLGRRAPLAWDGRRGVLISATELSKQCRLLVPFLFGEANPNPNLKPTWLASIAGRARPDEPEVVGGVQEEGW